MGLEATASRIYWNHADPSQSSSEHRSRAASESWFPDLSEARRNYLLREFDKRFSPAHLRALKAALPEPGAATALVCHWHLQWSDPLYREFTSDYLVGAWARPDARLDVDAVQSWLQGRGSHSEWSASTLRRLSSGLLAAAGEAGFLKGAGRKKELRTVTVDPAGMDYLREQLLEDEGEPGLGEEIFLSGTVPATTQADVNPAQKPGRPEKSRP